MERTSVGPPSSAKWWNIKTRRQRRSVRMSKPARKWEKRSARNGTGWGCADVGRIGAEKFLLSVGQRRRVGQSRGGIPIPVIEHHLEGIATSVAEMPDGRAIGIGHRVPLRVDQRLGQVAVIDPAQIELRGGAILFKDLRQAYVGMSSV